MNDLIRRYFIVELPNENVIHSLEVCIGDNDTQRYSLDNSKLYVKTNAMLLNNKIDSGTPMNIIIPPGLSTEYTLDEILIELQKPEWTNNEDII